VLAASVPVAGEAWAVTFSTDAACAPGDVDTASAVRKTLSSTQIANDLASAGINGATVQVQGTSPGAAHVLFYAIIWSLPLQWTVDLYAATPNLGAVITQVSLRGVNVTTEVLSKLSSIGINSIASLPSGFTVDRVYSCQSPTGDDVMVIEGHR